MGTTTTNYDFKYVLESTPTENFSMVYNKAKTLLEEVTQGVTSSKDQTGVCNKFIAYGGFSFGNNFGSRVYDMKGFAIKFDNTDTSIFVRSAMNEVGQGQPLIMDLIGNPVLKNYHLRYLTVKGTNLVVTDITADEAVFTKNSSGILSGSNYGWRPEWIHFSYNAVNVGRIRNLIDGHEYSETYAKYIETVTKNVHKLNLQSYVSFSDSNAVVAEKELPLINPYIYIGFRDCYLSIAPVSWVGDKYATFADDKNVNRVINNKPWNDYTVETPPKPSTDYTIYLDGTKLPNIKLVWHNTDIEDKNKTDNARIVVQYANIYTDPENNLSVDDARDGYAEIKTTEEIPYNDGNYKISFSDFYEKCGYPSYDEGIGQLLPKNSGWLIFHIDYYDDITQVLPSFSSAKMCARILPNGSLVGYHGAWKNNDGSTVKVISNGIDQDSGETVPDWEEDEGYNDPKDSEDTDLPDGQNNSIGVLTTTYNMSRERLNQLGNFLWSANIFDEFSLINSNPIENIISCKNIPMQLNGTDVVIKLGNVDTGVNGERINNNFGEITIGTFTVPNKYNNFLDLAPYTKITIYLPYIGFKELDTTIIMGKQITIKYVVDVLTGGCLAQVYVNNTRMYEFSGQVGVDIPITASNRAQVEAGYISGAISDGASLAVGDVGGVAKSIISSAMSKYHYSSTDRPNASCIASVNRTCYVIIDRPTYQDLKSFNHTKGRMCNLSKKIGSLRGFTICDSNIDLSGINATEDEKKEIVNILSNGFFA